MHYWNKLPREVGGSLVLEAFKTWLDKAMDRRDLVLAEEWTRDFSQLFYD